MQSVGENPVHVSSVASEDSTNSRMQIRRCNMGSDEQDKFNLDEPAAY